LLLRAFVVDACQGLASTSKVANSKCVFCRKKVAVWHFALRAAAARRVPDPQLRLLATEKLNANI